jgi:hypothetical protein
VLSPGNTLPGGSVVSGLPVGGVGVPLDGFVGVPVVGGFVGVPVAPFDVPVGVLLCARIEMVMGGAAGA